MREIKLAKNSGFCFGVKRAIEMTENAADRYRGEKHVYTCGPLIHNKNVTDELEEKGVRIINEASEADEQDVVIIRMQKKENLS